jgi:hypothetical protein
LRAQITFDSESMAVLKLRGPETRILTLTVAQEAEWQLYAPVGRSPEISELPFKIPGMWMKITPQDWPGLCPSSGIKAGGHSHQPK